MQTLAGEGFENIYNLSGGIKAWKKVIAVGAEETGIDIFANLQDVENVFHIGFRMEEGLREFYQQMAGKVISIETEALFTKLAEIEVIHQQRLLDLYQEFAGDAVSVDEFKKGIDEGASEGGLSTQEYLNLYETDLESELEILSLALAIEAQAYDLYRRAAEKSDDSELKKALLQIASEEQSHMAKISHYIDQQEAI